MVKVKRLVVCVYFSLCSIHLVGVDFVCPLYIYIHTSLQSCRHTSNNML